MQTATNTTNSKTILVVDDDRGILGAIEMILEESGFRVKTASTGTEAFRAAKKILPDLIILDILLSGTDGRDICLDLKQNPKTWMIPIVVSSAHPSAGKDFASYKADDFLEKPFTMDDLVSIVTKNLQILPNRDPELLKDHKLDKKEN